MGSPSLSELGWWLIGLGADIDVQCAAPRTSEVRAATASSTANDVLLPRCVGVVYSFRSASVVAIARPARCLMTGFDLKGVVIGGEVRVRGRTPFHFDREAWCTCF